MSNNPNYPDGYYLWKCGYDAKQPIAIQDNHAWLPTRVSVASVSELVGNGTYRKSLTPLVTMTPEGIEAIRFFAYEYWNAGIEERESHEAILQGLLAEW
jgi:hypothetical protein